jgi:class 3 adenylate cyclase
MSGAIVKRTLTAIVMADVVGYSRLMGKDEAGALRRLKACRAAVAPAIAGFDGRLVDATGDSLLMEFPSIVDAVEAAVAIQQTLGGENAGVAAERRLELRLGVNIGDVIVENGALYGDGVNVAARLQALAPTGGLCLSRAAVDQIQGKLDIAFEPLGPQTVKNIARPVEAFALSAAAVAALPRRDLPRPKAPRRFRPAAWAAALLVLLLALAGHRLWFPAADPAAQLADALSAHEPGLDPERRARLVSDYRALKPHRAFAFAPKAASHWWSGDWPSAAEAEEKALERCELRFGEPCALAARDETFVAASPPRSMPRVAYAGPFDPERIPGIRKAVAQRADVLGYRQATGPKAAAIHSRGVLATVTGARTQAQAEARALKLCNDDDAARDADGVCYLYAVGDDVVLSRRLTAPSSDK